MSPVSGRCGLYHFGPGIGNRNRPPPLHLAQAEVTEDSVYTKFAGIQTKVLALEASDFLKDLAQGVAQHFGATEKNATSFPAQQAANFAANSAASMLLTSLNQSLSVFLPSSDRTVTVESSGSRRLQGQEDEGSWGGDDGLTIIYVSSLDDYVCVGQDAGCFSGRTAIVFRGNCVSNRPE